MKLDLGDMVCCEGQERGDHRNKRKHALKY